MGYVGWLDTHEGNPDPRLVNNQNSQIVSELLSLGAVLYCKVRPHRAISPAGSLTDILQTSLPQTLLVRQIPSFRRMSQFTDMRSSLVKLSITLSAKH